MRRINFLLLWLVSLLGIALGLLGVRCLFRPDFQNYQQAFVVLSTTFLALAPWSVRLPSGSTWRPAMSIIMAGLFLLPKELVPVTAYPGLILITALNKGSWWSYPLTFGHVATGLYVGALLFQKFAPSGTIHFPGFLPAITVALAVHLIINRLIAAVNISYRTRKPLRIQSKQVAHDLNWGYFNGYLMALVTALIYQQEGPWGIGIAIAIIIGLYRSVNYYSRMQSWQKAAWTDGLTGVENRTAWEKFSQNMRLKPIQGTLAMIDLDDFKIINDKLGHATGDKLLKLIAASLQQNMRKSDRLFRYGGDEFICFFAHDTSAEDRVQERISQLMDDLFHKCIQLGVPTRASIGYASTTTDTTNFDELLALADSRMYDAKNRQKKDLGA